MRWSVGVVALAVVCSVVLSSSNARDPDNTSPATGAVPASGHLALLEDRGRGWYIADEELKGILRNRSLAPETLALPLDATKLAETDFIMLTGSNLTLDELTLLTAWVADGGALYFQGDFVSSYWNAPREFGIAYRWGFIRDPTNNTGNPEYPLIHVFASHPVTAGISQVAFFRGGTMNLSEPAEGIGFTDGDSSPPDVPVLAVSCRGDGLVAATADGDAFNDWGVSQPYDNRRFLENMVAWLLDAPPACAAANAPPVASAGGPYVADEGMPITFDATGSLDPDGDALTFRWDFDGDGTWDTDFGSAPTVVHTFGDDWTGVARVEVSDGALAANATANVTVTNVPPSLVGLLNATVTVDVILRIAGERWHDVTLALSSAGAPPRTCSVTRTPGAPDDQTAGIPNVTVDLLGNPWSAVVTYTPEDDPVNGQSWGATPAWILLRAEDGSEAQVHHTFNVRHPETWTWTIGNLSRLLAGMPIRFASVAGDPGSDDLRFVWSWGDGTPDASTAYYNDGVGPDPYPSPEVNPPIVTDTAEHTFSPGTYTVSLTVRDDDGGSVTASFEIVVGT